MPRVPWTPEAWLDHRRAKDLSMTPVEAQVHAEVARRGPIPFEEVIELALYDADGGFYATGGRAGRRGDFLTSPEVGPLFGAVVARALDRWWTEMHEPEVFTVVEAGAGPGTLARTILAASPHCARALRYVLVEPSTRQRLAHAEHLALDAPAFAFASLPDPDDEEAAPAVATGPIVVSLSDLPRAPGPCVVLANELLDNLAFGLAERGEHGWADVCVGVDGDALVEVLVPASHPRDVAAPIGGRIPDQSRAADWVRDARHLAGQGGRVVAIDYASTTADLAVRPWLEWVRTYQGHARGGHPLARLGEQDITCEVAVDQLPTPARHTSQADWLRTHGIEELVDEGRAIWRERAAVGDLEAIRARSRATEAEALLDPAGLGAFRVLEWEGG
jgi:SAM-dependent MidA family methyltransferase